MIKQNDNDSLVYKISLWNCCAFLYSLIRRNIEYQSVLPITPASRLERKSSTALLQHLKLQKCLANDDFVAVLQYMAFAWQQAASAIDKCSVGRTQVFDHKLPVMFDDARVAARNFGFRVVFVQID